MAAQNDFKIPQPPEKTSFFENTQWGITGILLGLFLLVIIFLSLHFLNILRLPFLAGQTILTQQNEPRPTNSELGSLPIPLSDPAVTMAGVSYTLIGRIASIGQTGENNEWQLYLQNDNGKIINTPLTLSSETPVTPANETSNRTSTPSLLKKDQRVTVNYYFDIKNNQGYVTSVQVQK